MPSRADQYNDLLANNEIVLQRLRGVCPLDEPTLLRARRDRPAAARRRQPVGPAQGDAVLQSYDHFDFKIPVGIDGDNWDRFAVRVAEIYESVKIIDQALDGLPEGPWITDDRKVALPPRHELATSMEALIHHFKLVTEGFRVPPGEVYYPIESPRGELGVLRALRRLVQARARAHARPLVREPPGDRADDRGLVHRRPHRDARDARPGARRDRPLMAGRCDDPAARAQVTRFGHGSRVPGWDDAADLDEGPGGRPRPRDDAGPASAARRDRGAHGEVPGLPQRRDPGARGRPAPPRLVLAEAIEQTACVMRLTPGYLISVATFYDMLETRPVGSHRVYVCTNISCSLCGADELLAACQEEVGDDPDFNVRSFECLGACDIAPMASVNDVYVGPIALDDCRRSSTTCIGRPPPLAAQAAAQSGRWPRS